MLGILPFIEKAFRITTSMTLLELADASHPLLRRLAIEAPGTYNHSLQVATLAEAAAEAIGANSLLCRVASYYHDVGKINKADYFIENQVRRREPAPQPVAQRVAADHHRPREGRHRAGPRVQPADEHLPVHPAAPRHDAGRVLLPPRLQPARSSTSRDAPAISETQYRYPGPKPRSKEVAIVMIADAVESATRAMPEPNASRGSRRSSTTWSMKRLLDGQFDECDLTMRELEHDRAVAA